MVIPLLADPGPTAKGFFVNADMFATLIHALVNCFLCEIRVEFCQMLPNHVGDANGPDERPVICEEYMED